MPIYIGIKIILRIGVRANYTYTSNEKIFYNVKGRDEEKVMKQDGMSTIIVNYSDKIIMK